jgi:hypothetical protein
VRCWERIGAVWGYEERMLSEDGESCIVNWVLIMCLYLTWMSGKICSYIPIGRATLTNQLDGVQLTNHVSIVRMHVILST